jgi:protein-serine/threonine kinase
MTGAPPRAMRDVFLGPEPQPESAPGLRDSDAPTVLSSIQDIHRRDVQANRVLNLQQDDPDDLPGVQSRPCSDPADSSTGTASNTLGQDIPDLVAHSASPSEPRTPLQNSTDRSCTIPTRSDSVNSTRGLSARPSALTLHRQTSTSSLKPVSRTPSFKQSIANALGSTPNSAYPSPVISAMGNITPLPSPLLSSDSPGPWRGLRSRSSSRETQLPPILHDSVLITTSGESVASALAHQSKRKIYAGLNVGHATEHSSGKVEHARNRSISEYIPDPKGIPRRQSTVSGPHAQAVEGKTDGPSDLHLRREPHLSEARGLTPVAKPPTPPPSESSQTNDSSAIKAPPCEFFDVKARNDKKLRRWRAIKELGQGTFSRVVLATSQLSPSDGESQSGADGSDGGPSTPNTASQPHRKTLVAIKVCEHGPRGGASENRIEMSLKRELEIMQTISHPSLVHLKAWNIEPTRALLVLSYCPGGDLFDVATTHRESLTAPLMQRIFAELVGAVRYLHERRIVHRDIKLESR